MYKVSLNKSHSFFNLPLFGLLLSFISLLYFNWRNLISELNFSFCICPGLLDLTLVFQENHFEISFQNESFTTLQFKELILILVFFIFLLLRLCYLYKNFRTALLLSLLFIILYIIQTLSLLHLIVASSDKLDLDEIGTIFGFIEVHFSANFDTFCSFVDAKYSMELYDISPLNDQLWRVGHSKEDLKIINLKEFFYSNPDLTLKEKMLKLDTFIRQKKIDSLMFNRILRTKL